MFIFKKKINFNILSKISFFIWILSIFAFLGEIIFLKPTTSGVYPNLYSIIFIFTIVCGSIAFVLFGISLFMFILRKMGILFIVSVFLLLASIVFVYFVIKTAPDRLPKTEEKVICSRSEMYPMPAEFQRALSLINERYVQKNDRNANLYSKMLNCINVQFGDTISDQAEGYFIFDTQNSTVEKLDIFVDASYTNYDDLTTALLLSHELTHARQFVDEIVYGQRLSCVNKEVEAFQQQLLFETYLNAEEQRSITVRAEKYDNNNPQLKWFVTLINYSWDAMVTVNGGALSSNQTFSEEQLKQYSAILTNKIRQMVVNDPGYQKKCNL